MSDLPPGWPGGWSLLQLPEVDSTMAEAARRAPGATGPLWITAGRQTAGRGRRGRGWDSPAGNLAATLLMPLDEPPSRAALRSFAAALALHDAMGDLTGQPQEFTLKWPNDVLLRGRKLAGILLELLPGGWLAVGVGVNLAAAPPPGVLRSGGLPAVSVAGELGLLIPPLSALIEIATAYASWDALLRTSGFAPLRAAWLARAAHVGDRIAAQVGRETLSGRFETIDAEGHLILRTERGPRTIAAGEVFLLSAGQPPKDGQRTG